MPDWQPIEARLISSRPSEDGWGTEEVWEFPGTSLNDEGGAALTVEDMQAAIQGIKEAPNGIFADESYFYKAGGWPNAP